MIVDEFVVELGLDPKKFTEGQKEAMASFKRTQEEATRRGKDIEASGKQVDESFRKVTRSAVGLFTLLAGADGLKQFVQNTIKVDEATGILAHNLGVSTEELSIWQGAVKQAGGTAEDAAAGFQSLVNTTQQIKLTGTSAAVPYLRLLGINSLAELENTPAALLKISDAMSKLSPARAQALGAGAGLTPGLINLLEQGPVAVRRYLDAQREAGSITEEDARAAAHLTKEVTLLNSAWTKLGRDILTTVVGPLTTLLTLLTKIGEKIAAAPATVKSVLLPFLAPEQLNKNEAQDLAKANAKGGTVRGGPGALVGKTPAQTKALAYFIGQGWTATQAEAIVTNLSVEDPTFDPNKKEIGGGPGYGLAQFGKERQADFAQFAGHGIQGSSVDEQLAFIQYELTKGSRKKVGDRLKLESDIGDATALVSRQYEQAAGASGDKTGVTEAARRAQLAKNMFGGSNVTNNIKNDVKVASVTINTKATDAAGIAADFSNKLSDYNYVAQSNTGLN